MSPLAFLEEGKTGRIVVPGGSCGCRPAGHACLEHIEAMGLRPGTQVEMISNRGHGPLVLRIDEARIALGRGMAMKIYVRRNGG